MSRDSMRSRHKQRGQIVALTMFLAIPAVLVLAYILNGGAIAYRKTEMQNATDTAVLTQAAWVARSLNVMSMNNTAMTQSFVISNAAWALEGPLFFAGYEAGEVAGYYLGSLARVAKATKGWGFAFAVVLYTYLYIQLNDRVLVPLHDFYEELSKAINDNNEDGGLARAAMGFGKMNTLLVQQGPQSMVDYNEKMAEANGLDNKPKRYIGWTQSNKVEIPVVEQSFAEFANNASKIQSLSLENLLKASESVRNVLNIRSSGEHGSYKTVINDEGDYFSNFDRHGYPRDEGPKLKTFPVVDAAFTGVHNELTSIADGSKALNIGTLITSILPGCDGFLSFVCEPIKALLNSLFNTLFKPLLNTKTDITPNDLKVRLEKVWQWSTLYRDTPYTKIPAINASWDGLDFLGLEPFASPPRYLFGLPFGTYRGYKGKSGKGGADTNIGDALEDAKKEQQKADDKIEEDMLAKLERDYQKCIIPTEDEVRKKYADLEKANEDSNRTPEQKQQKALELQADKDSELEAAFTRKQRCEQERKTQEEDARKELAKSKKENQDTGSIDEGGSDRAGGLIDSQDSGKAASSSKRNLLLWWYETAYQVGIKKVPLPLTELMSYVPSIRIDGLLDVSPFRAFEVDLYAVRSPRVVPEGALKLANLGGVNTGGVLAGRKDWSMVYMAASDIGVPILGGGFKKTEGSFATLAQAEVYNTQWFDLYTQNWRAKLTPVSLLSSGDHRKKIASEFSESTSLNKLLTGSMSENQLDAITTH